MNVSPVSSLFLGVEIGQGRLLGVQASLGSYLEIETRGRGHSLGMTPGYELEVGWARTGEEEAGSAFCVTGSA